MKGIFICTLLLNVFCASAQSILKNNIDDRVVKYPRHTEIYFNASYRGNTFGINRIINMHQRISFAYGGAYSIYSNSRANQEHIVKYKYSLDLPLEVRYYLLPRENRITIFFYCKLNNSFYGNQAYQSNIEMGAAVQLKISDKSSIFFKAAYSPYTFHVK